MQYQIQEKVWVYPGEMAAWYFVTLPKKVSEAIKKQVGGQRRGWGAVPVEVALGSTRWKTSIFPDKKSGAYLLPLKAEVRKKEGLREGDKVKFLLRIMGTR